MILLNDAAFESERDDCIINGSQKSPTVREIPNSWAKFWERGSLMTTNCGITRVIGIRPADKTAEYFIKMINEI